MIYRSILINISHLTTQEKYEAIAKTHVDTEGEATLSELLTTNNIPFKAEVIINKYRVDFLLDEHNIIEVIGGYHNTKKQCKKDKARETFLLKRGYNITEISNDDVFKCKAGEITLSELIKCDTRCIEEKFETCRKSRQVSKRVRSKMELTENPIYQKVMELKREMRKEAYRKNQKWKHDAHDHHIRKLTNKTNHV